MATTAEAAASRAMAAGRAARRRGRPSPYSTWFFLPAAIIYGVLFAFPTFASLFFSLTRWTLDTATFIGLDNYVQFFQENFLWQSLVHTLIYGVVTSGAKVVLGLLLAVLLSSQIFGRGYLRSVVFFPTLVSTVGVGITFSVMMHPTTGIINEALGVFGIKGPGWLTDPNFALLSIAAVDIWKGVGIATVIYLAGIASIPQEYYEAATVDGASPWQKFWSITLPLARPATVTVIILSLIGGLRSFDLIWTMTGGGPGFSSDTLASIIYKQYQAGFYGLATAGNVVLFAMVAIIIVPLSMFLNRRDVEAMILVRKYGLGILAILVSAVVFLVPFAFIVLTAFKDKQEAADHDFNLPTTWHIFDNLIAVLQTGNYTLVTAFINSIILTLVSVALMVVFGAMVGFVQQRRRGWWTEPVNFLVLAGLIVPPAIVPTIWVLQGLGLFKTLHGLILVEVAYGLSFCVLLFRAFVATIPKELDEAAVIDGAGPVAAVLPDHPAAAPAGDRHRHCGADRRHLQRLHQPALLPARQAERHRAADAL